MGHLTAITEDRVEKCLQAEQENSSTCVTLAKLGANNKETQSAYEKVGE